MYEMNENEKKLVEALRSGKYKQGSGQLKREEGDVTEYCCLGVACEISGLGVWERGKTCEHTIRYWVGEDCSDAFLPRPVREWLGWSSSSGALYEQRMTAVGGAGTLLTIHNDLGTPFTEIASFIEEGLVTRGSVVDDAQ